MYSDVHGMHTGTHNSFAFIPTANAIHGSPTLTDMNQDRERYTVTHKHGYMKEMVAKGPYKTMNLVDSILTINDPRPLQYYRARDRTAGLGRIQIMQPHGDLAPNVY